MGHFDDIEVDMIFPEDITLERLSKNICNFVVGYDVINAVLESPEKTEEVTQIFQSPDSHVVPSYDFQEFIYMKSKYMTGLRELGVPMAPTIFAKQGDRSPTKLIEEMKAKGWQRFVMKQSFSAFSLGFLKESVETVEREPKILEEYFEEFEDCPEYVVQEAIDGFTRHWETRCFWWNGEFQYAVCNKAAVSSEDGSETIITGEDIPLEFLEHAKRIGKEALKVLPDERTPDGKQLLGQVLVRTDIGCSDGVLHDKDTHWQPGEKTFFLNEIEYGGTTYFIRHLKFDAVPMWASHYADRAREINRKAVGVNPERMVCEKKRLADESEIDGNVKRQRVAELM